MSHIHLYMNNPTAGEVDGTEISGGDETLPLTLNLDASQSETAIAKCAVRCDTGYSLQGGATVYFEGTNADMWQIATDDGYDSDTVTVLGDWQSTTLIENVSDVNSIFWIKASSSSNEEPQNDASVDIRADGITVSKGA